MADLYNNADAVARLEAEVTRAEADLEDAESEYRKAEEALTEAEDAVIYARKIVDSLKSELEAEKGFEAFAEQGLRPPCPRTLQLPLGEGA